MTSLSLILLSIILLFIVFLALRTVFRLKLCAICASVSGTWIIFLLLFYFGYAIDPVLIGILLGGTAVGLMYFLEKKMQEKYGIFRLAFYLTAIVIAYMLLGGIITMPAVAILAFLWLLSALLFWGREKKGVKSWAKKIIECCKNW